MGSKHPEIGANTNKGYAYKHFALDGDNLKFFSLGKISEPKYTSPDIGSYLWALLFEGEFKRIN
jgi:hypothetical protein